MSGKYQAKKYDKGRERRLRRSWKRVISALSILVVIATIGSLTLPGIALDHANCGLLEHTHSEACYTPSEESRLACPEELHVHTEECYDSSGSLICGKADYVLHSHDEKCYDAEGALVCTLEECKEHRHTEACYETRQVEVSAAHVHTDDCYAMTKNTEPTCGQTHGHTGSCYSMVREALLCGKEESEAVYEEEKVLICTEEERYCHTHDASCGDYCAILALSAHQHTEECFTTGWPVLSCTKSEHTHGPDCYSDPDADVETYMDWEKTLPGEEELTGIWAQDAVLVARSQLGYEESSRNYLTDENLVRSGYTRYGAWYGNKYADWCAMFLAFCMNYAGVPEEAVPHHAGVESLKASFEELETYFAAEDYTPAPGDIVFYDHDGDGRPDHVGMVAALEEVPVEPEEASTEELQATLESFEASKEAEEAQAALPTEDDKVESVDETKPGAEPTEEPTEDSTEETGEEPTQLETRWILTAIEGNCDNAVKEVSYELTDERLLGYMSLTKAQEVYVINGGEVSAAMMHELSFEGEDYTVTVRYTDAALIPAGSTLTAYELLPGTEEYESYLSRSREALAGYEMGEARLFDITILDENGAEIQPATEVQVNITYTNGVSSSPAGYQAVHFGADGAEVLPVETTEDENGSVTGFSHTQSGFSVTVIAEITTLDGATYLKDKTVHVMVYSDYEWVEVGIIQGVYKSGDSGRAFFTDAQAYSVLKDYDYVVGFNKSAVTSDAVTTVSCYESIFGVQSEGTTWQKGFGLAINMDFTCCRWQHTDGTWVNGLSGPDSTSWTVYYLPANYTGGYPENKARQSTPITPVAMMQNDLIYRYANGFFSYNIKYWVHINGAWTCVGTTDRGHLGATSSASTWSMNNNRDYILESTIVEMFGPYGYSSGYYVGSSVAYHIRSGGKYTSDTAEFDAHGNRVYLMSRTGDALYTGRHAGYDLYYLPAGNSTTNSALGISCSSAEELITGDGTGLGSGNKFYTVSVRDPYGAAYSNPSQALVTINGSQYQLNEEVPYRHGTDLTITVNKGLGNVVQWQWVWTDGTRANAICKDNGDGTTTVTASSVNGELYLEPAIDLGSAILNEDVNVEFYVYLDDAWTQVGTTYGYVVGTASSGSTITDTNSPFYGETANRNFITEAQIYAAYAQYGYEMGDLQRWTKSGDPAILAYKKSGNITMGSMGLVRKIPNTDVMIYPFWTETGTLKVFYMPNWTAPTIGATYYFNNEDQLGESALKNNSAFYTVSVEDSTGEIYTTFEASRKTQIVQKGQSTTLVLDTLEGITWSAETLAGIGWEDTKVEVQSGSKTVEVTVSNVTSPLVVKATAMDPSFRIQYYSNIEHIVFAEDNENPPTTADQSEVTLSIIDTSGGVLPTNDSYAASNTNMALKYLTFIRTEEYSGQSENPTYGATQTHLYEVATEEVHTKMYADNMANFLESDTLDAVNKLRNNTSYTLEKVGVLKEGKSAASMLEEDFYWYEYDASANGGKGNIFLTNRAANATAPLDDENHPGTQDYTILVEEGFTLRLFYAPVERTYTHTTTFHDYNITNQGSYAGLRGINDLKNYDLSKRTSTGTAEVDSTTNLYVEYIYPGTYDGTNHYGVYAFGNVNTPNGVGRHLWKGNRLNGYNGDGGNNVFEGCTFEMVSTVVNDTLVFDETITAPTNLFGTGTALGKSSSTGTLTFSQVGDTYFLSAANSGAGTRSNLDKLFNPSPYEGKAYEHIYTNNFWVMDNWYTGNGTITTGDPLFGEWTGWDYVDNSAEKTLCTYQKLYGYANPEDGNYNGANTMIYAPAADDGVKHNYYFGMESKISFSLAADYAGPLDYTFFGDDDMWVFLRHDDTGTVTQICDIGGVHSAVGSYTDLRDYLPYGTSGNYTLYFFYTERGGSGSTCWMNFTLPAVSAAIDSSNTGNLEISKELTDMSGNAVESNELFQFQLKIYTDSSMKTESNNDYHAEVIDADGSVDDYFAIYSGRSFSIKAGQKVVISGLPKGACCVVTEATTAGYSTLVNGEAGTTGTATIVVGDTFLVFTNRIGTELPETGGAGIQWYYVLGLGLTLCAAWMLLRRRKADCC